MGTTSMLPARTLGLSGVHVRQVLAAAHVFSKNHSSETGWSHILLSNKPRRRFFAQSEGTLTPPVTAAPAAPEASSADSTATLASSSLETDVSKLPSASSASSDVSGNTLRRKFLAFYANKGHAVLPSASLVPRDPTVLLTIAGMLPFKPVFLGQEPRAVPRATSSQRCVRTNDVENVGRTARHHTFFEMLGNFSFGDYFKREAILWAWQLATQEFQIPSNRIWVSVFEEDDEAYDIWLNEVGLPPERLQRLGAEDNFWASGPTGPCGPCSELYFDFHPERGTEGASLCDDGRFIEFYNLVFMEANRREDGGLEPLASRNIDTGMGLERLAQILQGVPNNYETDLIFPIIQQAAAMAGLSYHAADETTKMRLKVVGDHARAVVFLVSDGVLPSNVGRGYVVRRLIRRLVRMGRLLGVKAPGGAGGSQALPQEDADGASLEDAFLPILAEKVIELGADIDPQVAARRPLILAELRREELRFVATLERGERLLGDLLAAALAEARQGEGAAGAEAGAAPILRGRDVFLLYDTFGFPVEITQEAAAEAGVAVDLAGFEEEMERQRRQSQAAHAAVRLAVGGAVSDLAAQLPSTVFTGYDTTEGPAQVLALVREGQVVASVAAGESADVVLDRTPFYAESGGQIGDWGMLLVPGGEDSANGAAPLAPTEGLLRVRDVQKAGGGLFLHRGVVEAGDLHVGQKVLARVDAVLRDRAKAHHTATHLLQSALRQVLGPQVAQAGSLVSFDRLRFDFSFPRALEPAELRAVEALVNGWVAKAAPVGAATMSLQEAKTAGAIAMFGEKYGDEVRVIDVPGISMELCGGTHVGNTAHIRAFKVLSEAGIAAGVRRIEAVAGEAALELLDKWDGIVSALSASLKVKPEDLTTRIDALQEELRASRNELDQVYVALAQAKAAALVPEAETVGPKQVRLLVSSLPGLSAASLKSAAEHLAAALGDPSAVVLGSASSQEGKVSLAVAFSPQVVALGLQAGKFVGKLAKVCGGGGGGRPNFAQAGGRLLEKLPEALSMAREELREQMSQ